MIVKVDMVGILFTRHSTVPPLAGHISFLLQSLGFSEDASIASPENTLQFPPRAAKQKTRSRGPGVLFGGHGGN